MAGFCKVHKDFRGLFLAYLKIPLEEGVIVRLDQLMSSNQPRKHSHDLELMIELGICLLEFNEKLI